MTNPIPDAQITRDNIAKCEEIVARGFWWNLWRTSIQPPKSMIDEFCRWNGWRTDLEDIYTMALAFIFLWIWLATYPILLIWYAIRVACSMRKCRLWIPFAKNQLDSK